MTLPLPLVGLWGATVPLPAWTDGGSSRNRCRRAESLDVPWAHCGCTLSAVISPARLPDGRQAAEMSSLGQTLPISLPARWSKPWGFPTFTPPIVHCGERISPLGIRRIN